MLSIFKKKTGAIADFSELGADMHSHLLPGIDDGSPDVETSLKLIGGLQELGFSRLVTTPHIMWDVYQNDADVIAGAQKRLQQATPSIAAPVPLHAAAEYFLDHHFDELLENNIPLLTIKDNWVLVEFSFVTAPHNYKEKIFNLQIKGYKPILAHPERYNYFAHTKDIFDELHTAGCMFQVNLLSIAGYYGKVPQDLARYFMKKKLVSLVGTDLHHDRHLHVLQHSPGLNDSIKSLLDTGLLLNPSIK